MLVWRILATYWKKLEYRTQSNLQVENNLQIQLAVLESDLYEGILLKCNFFLGIIFFHQRLQQQDKFVCKLSLVLKNVA